MERDTIDRSHQVWPCADSRSYLLLGDKPCERTDIYRHHVSREAISQKQVVLLQKPHLVNVVLCDNKTSGSFTASQVDFNVFADQVSPYLVSPLFHFTRKLTDAVETLCLHIIWHISALVQMLPASISWRNTTVTLPSDCVIGSKVFYFHLSVKLRIALQFCTQQSNTIQ